MSMNNKNFKDNIQRAECALLIYSWCGVFSALVVIGYLIRSLV